MRQAKEWWNTVMGNDETIVVNAVAIAGIEPHDKETEPPILHASVVTRPSDTDSKHIAFSAMDATPSAPPLEYANVDLGPILQSDLLGEEKVENDNEVNVIELENDWVELDSLVLKDQIAEDQRALTKQRQEETKRKFSSSQVTECLKTYNNRHFGKLKKGSGAMKLVSQLLARQNLSSHNDDCYVDLLLTLTQSDDIKLSDLAENRGFVMLLRRQEERFLDLYNNQYHSGTKAALAPFYRVVEQSLQNRMAQKHARPTTDSHNPVNVSSRKNLSLQSSSNRHRLTSEKATHHKTETKKAKTASKVSRAAKAKVTKTCSDPLHHVFNSRSRARLKTASHANDNNKYTSIAELVL